MLLWIRAKKSVFSINCVSTVGFNNFFFCDWNKSDQSIHWIEFWSEQTDQKNIIFTLRGKKEK